MLSFLLMLKWGIDQFNGPQKAILLHCIVIYATLGLYFETYFSIWLGCLNVSSNLLGINVWRKREHIMLSTGWTSQRGCRIYPHVTSLKDVKRHHLIQMTRASQNIMQWCGQEFWNISLSIEPWVIYLNKSHNTKSFSLGSFQFYRSRLSCDFIMAQNAHYLYYHLSQ